MLGSPVDSDTSQAPMRTARRGLRCSLEPSAQPAARSSSTPAEAGRAERDGERVRGSDFEPAIKIVSPHLIGGSALHATVLLAAPGPAIFCFMGGASSRSVHVEFNGRPLHIGRRLGEGEACAAALAGGEERVAALHTCCSFAQAGSQSCT